METLELGEHEEEQTSNFIGLVLSQVVSTPGDVHETLIQCDYDVVSTIMRLTPLIPIDEFL
jgi:NACalpha-BTF3-like transcription factor